MPAMQEAIFCIAAYYSVISLLSTIDACVGRPCGGPGRRRHHRSPRQGRRVEPRRRARVRLQPQHGALSTADGRIAARWQLMGESDAPQLNFVWQEAGGPPVAPPKRQCLGTRLIRILLSHELGGQAELSQEPAGELCEIEIPLARVTGAEVSSAA
jgi:hypothetical protein